MPSHTEMPTELRQASLSSLCPSCSSDYLHLNNIFSLPFCWRYVSDVGSPLWFMESLIPIFSQATVVLIVGYSWIDGHLPVLSNVGIGWPIAWKRWTLVMIGVSPLTSQNYTYSHQAGSAASFVVMMLPPKSARKAVRLGCAKTVTSLSHMYALIMSAWIRDAVPSKELKSGLPPWVNSFRKNLTAVALQLNDLKETARLARWEGSVRGHWPYEEYNKLVDVQQEMVTVFSQVSLIAL